MISMRMNEAKRNFFDRFAVIRAASSARLAWLSTAGAYTMREARKSIKKRPYNVSAPPGSPPFDHAGLLRNFIVFAYDHGSRSMVCGPVKLNGKKYGEAPPLLEYGGAAIRRARWSASRGKFVPAAPHTVVYRPRPFMEPAFTSVLRRLPEIIRRRQMRQTA